MSRSEHLRNLSPRVSMSQAGRLDSRCQQCDISYTDVVVIGNGPSGISLSYLLSGNWPYYTGVPHPDASLYQRLLNEDRTKSLLQQDLEYLSSGLEGRSSNPVALLFDALTHPDADMGIERPSLLEWRKHERRVIPHVVLGKYPPGGAWQMMEGQMQTLSLGNWMQLPNFPFKEWLAKHRKKQNPHHKVHSNRASITDVRQYYLEYVESMGISMYLRSHCTVTSVRKVLDVCQSVDDESGEQMPCVGDLSDKIKWEVCGYETIYPAQPRSTDIDKSTDIAHSVTREFCYRTPNVVLATGSFDSPNILHIPGEHYSYIKHSSIDLDADIYSGKLNSDSDPLVVVGAGLSAADAVLVALRNKIPVVQIFRRDANDPAIVLKKLPVAVYPEYHTVHGMMSGKIHQDGYECYPGHRLVECLADSQILIRSVSGSENCDLIVKASQVLVLIGSQPDLSFLSKNGSNWGIVPNSPIDSKNNPIVTDPYSFQSVHACGLYAMGPLVGDNFVRFLIGGAEGIVAHLWRKREGRL